MCFFKNENGQVRLAFNEAETVFQYNAKVTYIKPHKKPGSSRKKEKAIFYFLAVFIGQRKRTQWIKLYRTNVRVMHIFSRHTIFCLFLSIRGPCPLFKSNEHVTTCFYMMMACIYYRGIYIYICTERKCPPLSSNPFTIIFLCLCVNIIFKT